MEAGQTIEKSDFYFFHIATAIVNLFDILQMFLGICFTYITDCFPSSIMVWPIQIHNDFQANFTATLDKQMKTVIYMNIFFLYINV